jgi:galactitol-specific phosphotransferase system IIB component
VDIIVSFIINHNTAIIVATSVGITLLLLIYSTRSFIKTHDSSSATAGKSSDLSEIEALLKQVLSKSHGVTEAAESVRTDKTQVDQPGADVLAEIKKLQDELTQKQKEIEAAKNQFKGIDPEEKLKLENRIRELEAKLSEYEIIAEDIADLSRFREENIQLKKKISELESLAQSTSAGLNPQAEPKVTSNPSQENVVISSKLDAQSSTSTEDLISQNQGEHNAQEKIESTDSNTSVVGAIDDDLMAEFARAVEQQKMKESQQNMKQEELAVNLDSILNEANTLREPPADAEVVNSLDQELNADKLVVEAASLDQVRPEDIELMNNFEKFVKGR